jgi:hypothetical protein
MSYVVSYCSSRYKKKEDYWRFWQLQEDELRCQLLQQQIQEERRLLEMCYPEDDTPAETESPPRRHHHTSVRSEAVRPRDRTFHIEDGPNEDSEEEYRRRERPSPQV